MRTPKIMVVGFLALIALCIILPPVSAYQFSMTKIENFNSLPSLSPYGTDSHTQVYNWLVGQGWSQRFYETEVNVDDSDFATNGGGLDQSDLHYHFGHGDWISGTTYVQYQN